MAGPGADADEDPLRRQLLDAAARVFASQGYSGTKIMDIVKESGLSAGAVYGRFASKDELLMEAVLSRVDLNELAGRFRDHSVAEMLVESSRATGPLDDGEAMRLEAFIAARREPEVAKALREGRERWRGRIDPVVQRAIADGSASPDADFGSIVFFLETVRLGLMLQRGAGVAPPDDAAWLTFMQGVVRHMAWPDPPAGDGAVDGA